MYKQKVEYEEQFQTFDTGAKRSNQDGKPDYASIDDDFWINVGVEHTGIALSVDRTRDPIANFDEAGFVQTRTYSLIPLLALNRIEAHLHKGALVHGEGNWEQGIPLKRTLSSLLRHTFQWISGDTSEDHLAAIIVNAIFLMNTEHWIHLGSLPRKLANAGPLKYFYKKRGIDE